MVYSKNYDFISPVKETSVLEAVCFDSPSETRLPSNAESCTDEFILRLPMNYFEIMLRSIKVTILNASLSELNICVMRLSSGCPEIVLRLT